MQDVVNRANKEKPTFWLYCKHRTTKGIMCTSKAAVGKIELDGHIRYVLIDHTFEHNHPGTMGHVISENMKFEMCKRIEKNPEKPVSEARNAAIKEFAKKYERNPDLWS